VMKENGMTEDLKQAAGRIVELKNIAYANCKTELVYVIENGITDEKRIEALFDQIINFHDDDAFIDLFWTLISYVEKFDRGIGAFYRRLEELLHEGL